MIFIKQTFLYPLITAINFFSVTALLIISGLFGKDSLSADIAIIQGAIMAVFFALSGNARNLILANSSASDEQNLFYFRLLILFPAVILAFLLATNIVDVPIYLVIGLILRKCSEWIAELQLANREKNTDFSFARKYLQLNVIGFLLLIAALFFSSINAFYFFLYLWAVLPLSFVCPHFQWILDAKRCQLNFARFVPHIGSSAIIGITTYIFRILVFIFAGKIIAGQMFTAYALGGVVSSLYTYALGPTLILHEKGTSWKGLMLFFAFCLLLGSIVILSAFFLVLEIYSPLFLYAIGYSIIGGGIMLLAQHQRLYFLQVCKKDVFVPDTLANILLIASMPFAYYFSHF